MKKILQFGLLTLAGLVLTGTVSAHVSVNPKEAVPGYSVATVRVPNEKDVATVSVRVLVPEGVDVHGVMPHIGWTHTEKRAPVVKDTVEPSGAAIEDEDEHAEQGDIIEITWTGGKIGAGEFMEFPLSVQYSADVEKATWKAYQTYAGGEIVPWDGTDEKHPAPVVTISKGSGVESIQKGVEGMVKDPLGANGQWLSVGAFVLSAGALAMSLKKK